MGKIKVLYIGGYGRSGSTILERILGQFNNFFSIGEFRYIWERGFLKNQLCGCGKEFASCPFWINVVNEAFGGFDKINPTLFFKLKNKIDLKRNIPFVALPFFRSKSYSKNLKNYTDNLMKLYRSIQKVSGCNIIVDSSKNPSHGYILSTIDDIELYTLHLIRDSRATANSWLRKKKRPEIVHKTEFMPIMHPIQSSIEWFVLNTLTNLLKYKNKNYYLLRYEDLVSNVHTSLDGIMEYLGISDLKVDLRHENTILLKENHTVSGNPSRFLKGEIVLSPDYEWHSTLKPKYKILVTILTWPLLLKYGYKIFPP